MASSMAPASKGCAHQIVESVLGDDVVFQADAQIFLADVNPRLNREHMSWRDGPASGPRRAHPSQ